MKALIFVALISIANAEENKYIEMMQRCKEDPRYCPPPPNPQYASRNDDIVDRIIDKIVVGAIAGALIGIPYAIAISRRKK